MGRVNRPVGCDQCNGTGYRGRLGINEMMIMNSTIRDLAFSSRPWPDLRKARSPAAWRPLVLDGKIKILNGVTTPEEIAQHPG